MTRWFWLVLALCSAACHDAPPSGALQNQCFSDDACERFKEDRGGPATCDLRFSACVRKQTAEPYELFVRVSASAEGTLLADAGITLVPQTVSNLGPLREGRDAEVLNIPEAVSVPGSVRADASSAELLATEVTIRARDAMVPIDPSVFETRQASRAPDGGTQLQALLDPELSYDLHVQPLLASSATLPPMEVQDVPFSERLDIAYGPIKGRAGKLIYREEDARPLQVRLQDTDTGQIVSSSMRVEPIRDALGRYQGQFTLYAQPEVFERRNFNLVIGLADLEPWQVTIAIEGMRFLAGTDIFLPKIPKPVGVSGTVEDEQLGRLANVQLVFVSRYPLPPDAKPSTPSVGGTDWCRWEDPTRIGCSGRFQTMSSQEGTFQIDLVQGEYDAYILPNPREPSSRGLIVTEQKKFVVTDQGKMSGEPLVCKAADSYTGTVTAGQISAPQVTVRALRRPTPPFASWGSVADFNRTLSTVSNRNGHFELLPDVGYYDFVLEPADGSDFPWKLWLDCPNGPEAGGALRRLELSAPVMVSGVVEHERDGVHTRLPNARIEAFAIVESENRAPRSVLIGRTVSDQTGAYRLALPPRVGEGDRANLKCEGSAR